MYTEGNITVESVHKDFELSQVDRRVFRDDIAIEMTIIASRYLTVTAIEINLQIELFYCYDDNLTQLRALWT